MMAMLLVLLPLSLSVVAAAAGGTDLPSIEKVSMEEEYDNDEKQQQAATVVTIGFILLLHAVFVYEWNYRICRREIQSCYQTLVVEKKLHLLIVSLVSHAALNPTPSSGMSDEVFFSIRTFYDSICTKGGSLSGLPLLAWSSRLLWKFRLLEEQQPSSVSYCRMCLSLVTTAIVLEMLFIRCMSRSNVRTSSTSSRRSSSSTIVISSPSVLVGALLAIRYCLERSNGYSICLDFVILSVLSSSFHLFGSIFGLVSGLLYGSKITMFLVHPYWSNFLLLTIVIGCCISLKASMITSTTSAADGSNNNNNNDYLPCIDYVSPWWYATRGQEQQQQQQQQQNHTNEELFGTRPASAVDDYYAADAISMESGLLLESDDTMIQYQHQQHRDNTETNIQQQHGPRSRQRPAATTSTN